MIFRLDRQTQKLVPWTSGSSKQICFLFIVLKLYRQRKPLHTFKYILRIVSCFHSKSNFFLKIILNVYVPAYICKHIVIVVINPRDHKRLFFRIKLFLFFPIRFQNIITVSDRHDCATKPIPVKRSSISHSRSRSFLSIIPYMKSYVVRLTRYCTRFSSRRVIFLWCTPYFRVTVFAADQKYLTSTNVSVYYFVCYLLLYLYYL